MASELSLTEERERRRIATELHDHISQSLVISKMTLEQLRKSEASEHIAAVLDDVCNLLGQTIESSRLLTFDLSSPILNELGFETAVAEWLAEEIQNKHNIAIEFKDDGKAKPLRDDIRALLFRMVRELLINVVKHSQASKVKVSIGNIDSQIHICVEDNGVGFEPTKVTSVGSKTGGFGLFSIRERLEQLGGRFEIKSSPGCGCRITIAAPLKQTEGTNN
jgi:signal transduction histidine kinase